MTFSATTPGCLSLALWTSFLPDRQQEWRDRDAMGDGWPVTDNMPAGSPASDTPSPADGYVGDPAVRAEWDDRYADRQQLWSGRPNGALVAEVAGLTPGRALDVGCGEGADAVWLARGGWDVTALEVSGVAWSGRRGMRGTPASPFAGYTPS
jgi:SAM-dependent methyltransferase